MCLPPPSGSLAGCGRRCCSRGLGRRLPGCSCPAIAVCAGRLGGWRWALGAAAAAAARAPSGAR
eukprot:4756434-Alexandrium_andersonii.AAC.1